ncbi:NAD(P)-dependent oxidoreductase [Neobacillus mesonae]|uniref:NAD-dependent epimerase/dehydratase family protein n=1 Tax=Neobacillus mesonae TaxID=1193713 RepID=UPI00203A6735|nr:NAD(P)-dependent oxidoreductase [Neobacillus mesonae]MCM3569342.1 NAD(P)-dependent oxidoreductase [Neobacillus mesonae]
MTVLLTGGSGFVGINITERLLDENIDVVNYATLPVPDEAIPSLEGRRGNYEYVEGNVLDRERLDAVIKKYHIKTIIHAAVMTPDFKREQQSSKDVTNVNYMGTVEVLEAALRHGIEKFVYLSSVSVYGDTAYTDHRLSESDSIPLPRSLYEITKYAAERTVLRYKELFGLPVLVVRLGQVFGPWERYTGIRHTLSGPFQATRLAVLNQEALLPWPGMRDWVYSRDVANAILHLMQNDDLHFDLYNIGPGQSWSVEDWCKLLEKEIPGFRYRLVDHPDEATIDYFAPKDASRLVIERLQQDGGYTPKYGLKEAFHDYMNWIKNTSHFWTEEKVRSTT